MQQVLGFLTDLIVRFSARSFVLTAVVIYLVVSRPDMSIEQIIALLGALGFITVRAVAEDRVGVTHVDIIETDEAVNNTK